MLLVGVLHTVISPSLKFPMVMPEQGPKPSPQPVSEVGGCNALETLVHVIGSTDRPASGIEDQQGLDPRLLDA